MAFFGGRGGGEGGCQFRGPLVSVPSIEISSVLSFAPILAISMGSYVLRRASVSHMPYSVCTIKSVVNLVNFETWVKYKNPLIGRIGKRL